MGSAGGGRVPGSVPGVFGGTQVPVAQLTSGLGIGGACRHVAQVPRDGELFATIFMTTTAGLFASAFSVAFFALLAALMLLYRRRRCIAHYGLMGSLLVAIILQLGSYVLVWGMRLWCPGLIGDGYCRWVLALDVMSEVAVSLSFLYLCVYRVALVRYGGREGLRRQGMAGPCEMTAVLVLCWGAAFVLSVSVLTADDVSASAGFMPTCQLGGAHAVLNFTFYSCVVFLVPAVVLMSRGLDSRREGEHPQLWPIVRRGLTFYSCYFTLTLPLLVAETLKYLHPDAGLGSVWDYLELIGLIVYQLRLLLYVLTVDLVVRPAGDVGLEKTERESGRSGGQVEGLALAVAACDRDGLKKAPPPYAEIGKGDGVEKSPPPPTEVPGPMLGDGSFAVWLARLSRKLWEVWRVAVGLELGWGRSPPKSPKSPESVIDEEDRRAAGEATQSDLQRCAVERQMLRTLGRSADGNPLSGEEDLAVRPAEKSARPPDDDGDSTEEELTEIDTPPRTPRATSPREDPGSVTAVQLRLPGGGYLGPAALETVVTIDEVA